MVDPEKWAGILVDSREMTGDATIETLRFQDENENYSSSARFDFKFAGRLLNKKIDTTESFIVVLIPQKSYYYYLLIAK